MQKESLLLMGGGALEYPTKNIWVIKPGDSTSRFGYQKGSLGTLVSQSEGDTYSLYRFCQIISSVTDQIWFEKSGNDIHPFKYGNEVLVVNLVSRKGYTIILSSPSSDYVGVTLTSGKTILTQDSLNADGNFELYICNLSNENSEVTNYTNIL